MGLKFTGVRKDEQGRITELQTNDGQVLSFQEAKSLVEAGEVDSLTQIDENGTWEINAFDYHAEGDNLSDLPNF